MSTQLLDSAPRDVLEVNAREVLDPARARQILGRVDFELFTRRVVQEAITVALPSYWRQRAAVLEWARPRPTDFNGGATTVEVADRDHRLAEAAHAARCHAAAMDAGWW